MNELEQIQKENQIYRQNMPKVQDMLPEMSNELNRATFEVNRYKALYQQSQKENIMINKFNLAFIGMTIGTIGATILFVLQHLR